MGWLVRQSFGYILSVRTHTHTHTQSLISSHLPGVQTETCDVLHT